MDNNSGKQIIAISKREKAKWEIYRNTMTIKISGF